LSDREAWGLITLPGFSTAAAVTDLSGRGVGMDVVKTNLDQLGGTLEVDSAPGQGAAFSLRVPLTLAIIPCLMVRSGEQRYAIPQKDLEELVCLQPQSAQTRIETTLDQEVVRLRGRLLTLVRLAEVLDRPQSFDIEAREAIVRKYRGTGFQPAGSERIDDRLEPDPMTLFAVVKVGERRFGLVVDEILKNEEIVVKPMHSLLKPLSCFSGATILGDGRVALILNMEGIVQHAGVRFGSAVEQRAAQSSSAAGPSCGETTPALLFRYGPQEQFAVPLAMIRRLVMIDPHRIERVGPQELMVVDGETTPLLRLDQV
jgi:two-component system chemotaxis sensor kinase CheA